MNKFENKFPNGAEFRKVCFWQINDLLKETFELTNFLSSKKPLVGDDLTPIVENITRGKQIIDELARFISDSSPDKIIAFHMACYCYVIVVEGIFDELARILYSFYRLKYGEVLTIKQLQGLGVSKIDGLIEPKLIIFRQWELKKHLRNAISHANVYYTLKSDKIGFVDRPIKNGQIPFEITLSFKEFVGLLSELEDSIDALQWILLISRTAEFLLPRAGFGV